MPFHARNEDSTLKSESIELLDYNFIEISDCDNLPLAQTFIPTYNGSISKISLYLDVPETPQTLTIKLYRALVDGSPPLISEEPITSKNVSTSGMSNGWNEIALDASFVLIAGVKYAIVVQDEGGCSLYYDTTDPYENGNEWSWSGAEWQEDSYDFSMKIYILSSDSEIIKNGVLQTDLGVLPGKTVDGVDVSETLVKNGIDGEFTTVDGKTITIVNGQVTEIAE